MFSMSKFSSEQIRFKSVSLNIDSVIYLLKVVETITVRDTVKCMLHY